MTLAHPSLRWLAISSALFGAVSSLPSPLDKRAPGVIPAFTSLGCVSDNEGGKRALTGASTAASDMTVGKCAAFCSKFQLFGLEYGVECYCGNSRDANSREVDIADCSFPCPGNNLQNCGAGDRLNLYSILNPTVQGPATLPGVTSLGCFVDNGNRVLPSKVISADDMTAAKCAANCAGYDYFGTQWGRECYCGSVAPTVQAPASECSMPCAGDDNELCGAGMRLSVYKYDTASTSPPAPTIDGFEYQGCYTDNIPQRVLGGWSSSEPTMTPANCATSCKAGGYKFFGVEFGVECYCSTSLDSNSAKVADSECTMACGGNSALVCGGPNRLTLYAVTTEDTAGGNVASIGDFTYRSCWTDDTADRSLKAADYRTDDMTVEKCADRCKDYSYFGLEFSRECYCGNALGGQAAPEKDCSMLCVGSNKQWCGGPVRMNLYAKSPASPSSSAPAVEPTTTSTTASEAPSVPSETSTTVAPDPTTTTTETSAGATATEAHTTSLLPTSTTTEPTTTAGPAMTTVTSCPSAPTYIGIPENCYNSALPASCERLTSAFASGLSRSMSMSITNCRSMLTKYGMTTPVAANACIPTPIAANPPNAAAASSTMRSVYSCLQSVMRCQSDMACATNTYPADQVPEPTPSIGVNVLKDSGFESGTFGDWTVTGDPNWKLDISNGRPKTGNFALRARYDNNNGASALFQRLFHLEPGKQYTFKVSFLTENAVGSFYLRVNDILSDSNEATHRNTATNVWRERALTFTATTSVMQLYLYFVENVVGAPGSSDGVNTVWIDDITLTRLN